MNKIYNSVLKNKTCLTITFISIIKPYLCDEGDGGQPVANGVLVQADGQQQPHHLVLADVGFVRADHVVHFHEPLQRLAFLHYAVWWREVVGFK